MLRRFFIERICPVCAQYVQVHRGTGTVADHSRSKAGRVMPRCPQVGLPITSCVGLSTRLKFYDACEDYRNGVNR